MNALILKILDRSLFTTIFRVSLIRVPAAQKGVKKPQLYCDKSLISKYSFHKNPGLLVRLTVKDLQQSVQYLVSKLCEDRSPYNCRLKMSRICLINLCKLGSENSKHNDCRFNIVLTKTNWS